MIENYPKAYTEVIEILKYMPKEDVEKIPKKMLDTFEYKRDKNYNFTIAENQDFSKLKILDETEAIIVNIFKDYWATPEQKAKIQAKMQEEIRRIEEEKKAKYSTDVFHDIDRNKKEPTEIDNVTNEGAMVKYKENIFSKIIKRIKAIFCR